ncbi:MAG: AAA family ATPase [Anaerolineae bacterium]
MRSDVVSAPHTGNYTIFLSGPPGSGKTTLAVSRLLHLLQSDIPAEQILILVPQRTLATPYYQALHTVKAPAGGVVDIATIGGLARRTLDLFWPLVAGSAGFAAPNAGPLFLTLETAQYYMDQIIEPFISSGAFDGITIPRARLVSQIIDNLNKAAAVGFPPDQIAARLKSAWAGESAMLRIYDQVQAVALMFRQTCLSGNLLDWSLQIEVFGQHLLRLPELRRYLLAGYRHLIVDNSEEDIPVCHDLLRAWLPLCESALVLHDTGGGYRVFLGADPQGALRLSDSCREHVMLTGSHVTSPEVAALGAELASPFTPERVNGEETAQTVDPRQALGQPRDSIRFHPQMLDWVAEEISQLVMEEELPAGEIAVLAPFLSDALRFSLTERLMRYNIPVRTHRPSRELREEPAARCLLTLAKLAHPAWGYSPPAADVAHALMLSIANLDPVRGRLLTDIVYRIKDGHPTLAPFHQIVPEMQQRISYMLGTRYDDLRDWIHRYTVRIEGAAPGEGSEALDHFFSRLFGEVLSQVGFGFHGDYDAGAVAASLIESVRKFRDSFSPLRRGRGTSSIEGDPSQKYIEMVERGVVAAQYISSWQVRPENAVLLVPAYTFLMMNHPVTVQFWLNAGSRAWFERIYQPLTHPYVLHRDWPEGQIWADEDEVRVRQEALARLILGLTRRCRQRIYLAHSDLSEQGYEQQGPLLRAVQRLLRGHRGGNG